MYLNNTPISTAEAALFLGLNRPGFLVLKRFFGIEAIEKRKLRGTTPSNFFDPEDINWLKTLQGSRKREWLGGRNPAAVLDGGLR